MQSKDYNQVEPMMVSRPFCLIAPHFIDRSINTIMMQSNHPPVRIRHRFSAQIPPVRNGNIKSRLILNLNPSYLVEFFHIVDRSHKDRISLTVFGANRKYDGQTVEIAVQLGGMLNISRLARSLEISAIDRDTGRPLQALALVSELIDNDTCAMIRIALKCGYTTNQLKVWFFIHLAWESLEANYLMIPIKLPIGTDRLTKMRPRIPGTYPSCKSKFSAIHFTNFIVEDMVAIEQQLGVPNSFRYGFLVAGESVKLSAIDTLSAKYMEGGIVEIIINLSRGYRRKLSLEILNSRAGTRISANRMMAEPDLNDIANTEHRKFRCVSKIGDFVGEIDVRLTFEMYMEGFTLIPLLVIRRTIPLVPASQANSQASALFDMDVEEQEEEKDDDDGNVDDDGAATTGNKETGLSRLIRSVMVRNKVPHAFVQMQPLTRSTAKSSRSAEELTYWYPQVTDEFGGVFKFPFYIVDKQQSPPRKEQIVFNNADCSVLDTDAVAKYLKCSADLFMADDDGKPVSQAPAGWFDGIAEMRVMDVMNKELLAITSPTEQLSEKSSTPDRPIKLRWLWTIRNSVSRAKIDLCFRLQVNHDARFSLCSQFFLHFHQRGIVAQSYEWPEGEVDFGEYYDKSAVPVAYSSPQSPSISSQSHQLFTMIAAQSRRAMPQIGYLITGQGILASSLLSIIALEALLTVEQEILCVGFRTTDSSEQPTFKLAINDRETGRSWQQLSGQARDLPLSEFSGSETLSVNTARSWTTRPTRLFAACTTDNVASFTSSAIDVQLSVDMFHTDYMAYRAVYEFLNVPVERSHSAISDGGVAAAASAAIERKKKKSTNIPVGFVGAEEAGLSSRYDVIETVNGQLIDRSDQLMTVKLQALTKHPLSRRLRLQFNAYYRVNSNQQSSFIKVRTKPLSPRWSRDWLETDLEIPLQNPSANHHSTGEMVAQISKSFTIYVEVCLVRRERQKWWRWRPWSSSDNELVPIYRSQKFTINPLDIPTANPHYIPLGASWLRRNWLALKHRRWMKKKTT